MPLSAFVEKCQEQLLFKLKSASAQMTDAQRLQYQQAVRNITLAMFHAQDKDPAVKINYGKSNRSVTAH
jgi:hypothetical protein